MWKRLSFMVVVLSCFAITMMAQITTSGISGKITTNGEEVIGATVTAKHLPSGTVYRAVTNIDGRYTIQGMRVGGPYEVEITYVGHKPQTFKNVSLLLGEVQNLSCGLEEDAKMLGEAVVMGKKGFNATKTGAAQSISAQMINDMPSISKSIADMARLNPQLAATNSGVMSFAGVNNRYSSFMIDGAMNNDVFGLSASGSNGGQAGGQPVSMETIDQIQVSVAPFDVRQSGFTGGAINAITKSGTNAFKGSAYFYGNNENLIGKKYKLAGSPGYAPAYNDQKEHNFGFTLGGPIIKDKLFFFVNYENTNKTYPNLYSFGSAESNVDMTGAAAIVEKINEIAAKQGVTYRGAFSAEDIYTKSQKGGVKLDWNINEFHKATLRWSIVNAKQLNNAGGITSLNDNLYSYPFESITNTLTAELQSRFSPVISNEFRASYVRVRDQRKVGSPFPMISIAGVGGGSVNLGNERSSMANSLDQDIFTVEDNLTWYKGNHTWTFGTHNELYDFSNLFIQDLYGSYSFSSLDAFNQYYNDYMAGTLDPTKSYINQYRYGHANVDVTGDPGWRAAFKAAQLGFYAQDKWDATNNFQLTFGLRMDMPIFFDTPTENPTFNEYAAKQGWDLKTNHKLAATPLWSPRVGFRWDIANDHRYILRGGVGIFTGRIPFVWISNNYSNTGIQMSGYNTYNTKGLELILDPNGQETNAEKLKASGNQVVNVYDKNFKFAQNLKLNLGFDFELWGINWTAEGIFSKTLNDILYKNLAYEQTGLTLGQKYAGLPWDNRPLYTRVTTGTPFTNIYALYNTSKGYTVNLSLKAEKHFDFGLDLMASYTWTKSMSVNNGGSSVAESNWRYNYTYRDANNPELANSAYNIPHRIQASAFYHLQYGKNKSWQTTIGLIYQAKSGSPYTLYYYGDVNEDGANGNDLLFIPTDAQIDKMQFEAVSFDNSRNTNRLIVDAFGEGFKGTLTPEMQRTLLKNWIANDSYMSKHRGEYYKRYADNLAFEHHFDVHIAQKYSFRVGKQINSLELSFDIINLGNLLNKDWGHTYGDGFGVYYSPVNYQGGGVYQFTGGYATRNYSDYYSRWRGQIGLKYTF
ncbi:MAG: TonB-dependent receptor [Prevotella sp.]|nr:TonB-dependent receptor [Prevotella sp.]